MVAVVVIEAVAAANIVAGLVALVSRDPRLSLITGLTAGGLLIAVVLLARIKHREDGEPDRRR